MVLSDTDNFIQGSARRLSRFAGPFIGREDLEQAGYVAALSGGEQTRIYGAMIWELRKQRDLRQAHEQTRAFVPLDRAEELASDNLNPEFVVGLYGGIARLRTHLRSVLCLTYAGYTAREISAKMGISVGSVYQYAHHARNHLARGVL